MIERLSEYDGHKFVHFIHVPEVQLKAIVAIHTADGITPSFGATRFWKYKNGEDAAQDALRLAKLMSLKSASAGLPYGGAKAVIMEPDAPYNRKAILKAYAKALNELHGRFITGTDVGLSQEDVEFMRQFSPHLVGLQVDPTTFTAEGVLEALAATLEQLDGSPSPQGRCFAIQGLGKIGMELCKKLVTEAKQLYVSDIDQEKVAEAVQLAPQRVIAIAPADIHKQQVDIFMPCALSGIINQKSIEELHCKAIVGAANNQLASMELSHNLHQKGILYAPDHVANAGGLISVTHEYQHSTPNLELLNQEVKRIGSRMRAIYQKAHSTNTPPLFIAEQLANHTLSRFIYHV